MCSGLFIIFKKYECYLDGYYCMDGKIKSVVLNEMEYYWVENESIFFYVII